MSEELQFRPKGRIISRGAPVVVALSDAACQAESSFQASAQNSSSIKVQNSNRGRLSVAMLRRAGNGLVGWSAQRRSGLVAGGVLTILVGVLACVWPFQYRDATAFVSNGVDLHARSLMSAALEYSTARRTAVDAVPEQEKITVRPRQAAAPTRNLSQPARAMLQSGSPSLPGPQSPANSNTRTVIDAPKVPNRAALTAKVHRIIKEHSPRNRAGRDLAEAIVKEAKDQGYDPLFVAAVIKSESTFNAMARSNKGAQGLMQLMPATGAWIATQQAIPKGKLTDPGYNLHLGISYLKHLEALYKGDRVLTLLAYNWGPGRVESASGGKRRVPSEVVVYAVKIMNDYRRWRHDLSTDHTYG